MFEGALFSQSDSLFVNNSKLYFQPSFHGIQIDGTALILMYEYSGQLDFDLLRSNNNVCIGVRMSAEHYAMGDFGGSTMGSPFTNYNLYFRISTVKDYFSTSVLFGVSKYETSSPEYVPNENLLRGGFEIKYGKIISLIFKGSTSFKERTTFIGLGLSLDYNHYL